MMRIVPFLILIPLLHCAAAVSAQTPGGDFDVFVMPVGVSVSPPGKNLASGTLAGMGLITQPVRNLDGSVLHKAAVVASEDRLEINMIPEEGVQIWSEPIAVSGDKVYFTCVASVSGDSPSQAALAWVDADDPQNIGVSISLNDEIPGTKKEFALEYQPRSGRAFFLIQLVGPPRGESNVTIERLRVMDGYRELDYAAGATSLSLIQHFGAENEPPAFRNEPPSTPGGSFQTVSFDNRTPYPGALPASLLLQTASVDDVIEVSIPLAGNNAPPQPRQGPLKVHGRAHIKRVGEGGGVVSAALFSGATGTGGYTSIELGRVPEDGWTRIESPVEFTDADVDSLVLILQLRGGPAAVAVDDVSLHTRRDSPHFWDASLFDLPDPGPGPLVPLVDVPSGSFLRGSRLKSEGGEVDPLITNWLDELPQREIEVSGFKMDRYEISNDLYYQFWIDPDGGNGERHTPGRDAFNEPWPRSFEERPNHPVVSIDWADAMAFCEWRTRLENIPEPFAYRLPSEAEWEYAARGRSAPGEIPRRYPWGWFPPERSSISLANRIGNSDGYERTAPVRSFENVDSPFGTVNMAGNVWEWCLDLYDANYYAVSPAKNPMGPAPGGGKQSRVIRGGGWTNPIEDMRVAHRVPAEGGVIAAIGFRCVLSDIHPEPEPEPSPTSAPPTATPVPPTPTASPSPTPVPGPTPTPDPLGAGDTDTTPLGVEMVYMPAGSYFRGNNLFDDFNLAQGDERPRRSIFVSAFWMDKTEVTVELYSQYLFETTGSVPDIYREGLFSGRTMPATQLTYDDALKFCRWRAERENLPEGQTYRLPTEAEWEYAARFHGPGAVWPWGNFNPASARDRANLEGNADGYVFLAPVGTYPLGANPAGILDLAGNAAELCLDWYGEDYYARSVNENPLGPSAGQYRVVRGGSWQDPPAELRAAARNAQAPFVRSAAVGFRCVRPAN